MPSSSKTEGSEPQGTTEHPLVGVVVKHARDGSQTLYPERLGTQPDPDVVSRCMQKLTQLSTVIEKI